MYVVGVKVFAPPYPPKYEKTKPYQLSSMSVFEVSADKGKCCIHAYHLKSCQLLPVISGWELALGSYIQRLVALCCWNKKTPQDSTAAGL